MEHVYFHIDVNSAFLSWSAVEALNNGGTLDYRTVPAIVGGDPSTRHGIVVARSIPAKKYGIITAEPVASAMRKCPVLTVIEPNFALYSRMSRELFEFLSTTYCPDIEQASIDECYMDFTPIMHKYSSPVEGANIIKDSVRDRFGFTVNIGVSDRKVLAKMASDFKKPDLVHTLFSYEIKEKMWPLPVEDLFLCGKASAAVLKKLGITTIGELATADLGVLRAHLKSQGDTLYDFANGKDFSGLWLEETKAKGVGNTTTVQENITERSEAIKVLLWLCENVARRLRKHCQVGYEVTVEIKYADFKTVSRQMSTDNPVSNAGDIHEYAIILFDKLWNKDPIRLLGVRVTKLKDETEPVQMSVFDIDFTKSDKQKKLDASIDKIREKYGYDAIIRGSLLTPNKKPSDD